MSTLLFVNIPTANIARARSFYETLGWRLNPQFSDDNAICVVIDEYSYLMVLKREFYQTFLDGKTVGNPARTSLALISFTLPSRAAVDGFLSRVGAAGGRVYPPRDLGFMYQGSFDDPDGNHFEPFWMDQAAVDAGHEGP